MNASDNRQQSVKLWRQGLACFRQYWREWLPLGIIFAIVVAPLNILTDIEMRPVLEKMKSLNNQHAMPDLKGLMSIYTGPVVFLGIVGAIVGFIQNYFFLSFFMRKEMPGLTSAPTAGGCLRFTGIILLLGLFLMLPFLLVLIAILAAHGVPYISAIATGIATLAMIYLIIQIYAILPLVAGNIKEPIDKGWTLARGNWWRLAGNVLMLILVFLLFILLFAVISFLLIAIGYVIATAMGVEFDKVEMASHLKAGLNGLVQAITTGIYSAFASVAVRTLYEEKHAAEPNFVLETRT